MSFFHVLWMVLTTLSQYSKSSESILISRILLKSAITDISQITMSAWQCENNVNMWKLLFMVINIQRIVTRNCQLLIALQGFIASFSSLFTCNFTVLVHSHRFHGSKFSQSRQQVVSVKKLYVHNLLSTKLIIQCWAIKPLQRKRWNEVKSLKEHKSNP